TVNRHFTRVGGCWSEIAPPSASHRGCEVPAPHGAHRGGSTAPHGHAPMPWASSPTPRRPSPPHQTPRRSGRPERSPCTVRGRSANRGNSLLPQRVSKSIGGAGAEHVWQ